MKNTVRDRPAKTDAELFEEYFNTDCPASADHTFNPSIILRGNTTYGCCGCRTRYSQNRTIEEELGKEKILEERVRRLEVANTENRTTLNRHTKDIRYLCVVAGILCGLFISYVLFS